MDFYDFELTVKPPYSEAVSEMVQVGAEPFHADNLDGPAMAELLLLQPDGEVTTYYGDELVYLRGIAWSILHIGGQRELQRVLRTPGQLEIGMPEIDPDCGPEEFKRLLDKSPLDDQTKRLIRAARAAHEILTLTSRVQLRVVP